MDLVYIVVSQDAGDYNDAYSVTEWMANSEEQALEMALAAGYGHEGRHAWVFPKNSGTDFAIEESRKLTYAKVSA